MKASAASRMTPSDAINRLVKEIYTANVIGEPRNHAREMDNVANWSNHGEFKNGHR